MNAKHVALLALLSLGGSALVAQPPDAPPPDQYDQGPDSYGVQPAAYQPPDQYGPDQGGAVDETYFYDQLSPYGSWVESSTYGWVWLPYGIRASWRPYALGHWVMTDYGWTWVSDEPFGWAVYHYGRWVFDPDYGWEWIPGYEWGPAWVAWRTGAGYIGWAPLPPEVRFRVGFGLDFGGVDLNVVLGPTHFCFVEERAFLRVNVFTYVEPPARNVTIINNTTNITNYTVVNNRVVNQGIAVQHVEQVTGQRVQRLQVAAVKSAGPAPRSTTQVRGSQLMVFQPPIVKKSAGAPPPPPQRVRASGADLQRRQQQESQSLKAQQAQERTKLQQIHQREAQGGGAAQGGAPSNQRQRSAQEQQAPPERQRSAQEQAPPERQRSTQEQQAPPERQQQAGQRHEMQQRGAAGNPDLAQRHQAEAQAQQQQHQREQQQLEARHRAEQQAAQRQPQPQQQQRKGEQKEKEKKQQEKSPPPPRR